MTSLRPEFAWIERLRGRCPTRPPVVLGIGDDAAVLRHDGAATEVVTTDMLMEGVDFLLDQAAPELIGRKALAVNLSDLAAMGARPTAAFVSVAFPKSRGIPFADHFYDGLMALAAEYAVTIAGGDTNTWDGPFVCSITAVGEPCGPRPILRSGACPGDGLYVTGALGGSLAGRHLRFTPRLREAARLATEYEPHAMLDISDGLAADLHHILEASRVGAVVDAAAIPIHADAHAASADGSGRSPLEHALSDGEDFELLFTLDLAAGERLTATWTDPTPITRIGTITCVRDCVLRTAEGHSHPLPPRGWTHDWEV